MGTREKIDNDDLEPVLDEHGNPERASEYDDELDDSPVRRSNGKARGGLSPNVITMAIGLAFAGVAAYSGYEMFLKPAPAPMAQVAPAVQVLPPPVEPIQAGGYVPPVDANGNPQMAAPAVYADPSLAQDPSLQNAQMDPNSSAQIHPAALSGSGAPVPGVAVTPTAAPAPSPVPAAAIVQGAPQYAGQVAPANAQVAQAAYAHPAPGVKVAQPAEDPKTSFFPVVDNANKTLNFPDEITLKREGGPMERRIAMLEAKNEQIERILSFLGFKFSTIKMEEGPIANVKKIRPAHAAKPKSDKIDVAKAQSQKSVTTVTETITGGDGALTPNETRVEMTNTTSAQPVMKQETRAVASIKPTSMSVYAVVQGRAWVKDNLGNRYTVTVGEHLPGYGSVVSINPEAGNLVTSAGTIN